jgi:hypothetical protein
MSRIVRLPVFVSKFLIFFILAYLVWWTLTPGLNLLLAEGSNAVLSLAQRRRVTSVEVRDGSIQAFSLGADEPVLSVVGYRWHYDFVLLVALILATPSVPFHKHTKILILGVAILLGFHVVNLVVDIKYLCAIRGIVPLTSAEWAVYDQIFMLFTMGTMLFPLLIWGLLTFKYWLPVPCVKVKLRASKIGRNDPCPCHSGKKYKHCCGK